MEKEILHFMERHYKVYNWLSFMLDTVLVFLLIAVLLSVFYNNLVYTKWYISFGSMVTIYVSWMVRRERARLEIDIEKIIKKFRKEYKLVANRKDAKGGKKKAYH